MNRDASERIMWILSGLNLYPPSIQESIISDYVFRTENNIVMDAEILMGNNSVGFKRSLLLKSIREVFSNTEIQHTLNDENGEVWNLSIENIEAVRCIRLTKDSETYLLDAFWPLLPKSEERLSKFKEVSQKHQLPQVSGDHWNALLTQALLTDDDFGELQDDLKDTQHHVSEQLKSEMKAGSSSIQSLVPQNVRYYERLVGKYLSSSDIVKFSLHEADSHFKDIFLSGSYSGLMSCLLMAVHSSIADSLVKIEYDESVLIQLYDSLVIHSDPFSRVGAIEIGLSLIDKYSFLETYIETLVKQTLEEKEEGVYNLLSAVIMLVDGELARLQIFKDKPPFYRRLASFAQASLIANCAVEVGIEINSFSQWAEEQRKMPFYCQTIIDLRLEPRWHPNYLTPGQLKAELLCRISNSAKINNEKINSSTLKELLLGDGSDGLQDSIKLNAYLPGPLEGNIAPGEMPLDISKIVESGLSSNKGESNNFTALVNSAQYWKLESGYTELALKVLQDAEHRLMKTENEDEIIFTLEGLARVAAITKNTKLAEELCILARKYRNYLNVNSHPQNMMVIGLISAA
ncbi:MAG: hypothetical protein OEY89_14240, partial [Gammaproteobacteria bacterium]|nr:hypothetical protein [Gammaproteobacteria bacterium]